MEKYLTAKNFRRCAAVVTVFIALVTLLAPFASARYNEKVANIDTDANISGITATQADNLMIYLMNVMYPVDSIYMTTSITTPAAMNTQFGGTWVRWGLGRVPVGADSSTLGANGGTMGGPSTPTVGPFDLATSNPSISAGKADLLADGSATHGNNAGLTFGTAGRLAFSLQPTAAINLSATHYPSHNHSAKVELYTWGTFDKSIDNDGVYQYNAGTTSVSGTTSAPLNGATAVVSSYSFTPVFNFSMPRSGVDSISFATFPGFSYSPPVRTYTQQTLTKDITVVASGTIAATDTTLQPYQTCYMYRRTALAALN